MPWAIEQHAMTSQGRTLLAGLLIGIAAAAAGCRTVPAGDAGSVVLGTVPALQVPRTAVPPAIDGSLTDRVWAAAAVIPALVPAWRAKGRDLDIPATSVRLLWDTNCLYVGFECQDSDIYCSGALKHDDLLYKEDVCEVFIDGVGDGRQFVEIQVNPDGVNLDLMYVFTRAAAYTRDMRLTPELCARDRWKFLEWEMPGLRTAGRRTDKGWSVELAIPAEAIMRRKGSPVFLPTRLRANVVRYDWPLVPALGKRELRQANWSPVLWGNPHNAPARMGILELIDAREGATSDAGKP